MMKGCRCIVPERPFALNYFTIEKQAKLATKLWGWIGVWASSMVIVSKHVSYDLGGPERT